MSTHTCTHIHTHTHHLPSVRAFSISMVPHTRSSVAPKGKSIMGIFMLSTGRVSPAFMRRRICRGDNAQPFERMRTLKGVARPHTGWKMWQNCKRLSTQREGSACLPCWVYVCTLLTRRNGTRHTECAVLRTVKNIKCNSATLSC